MRIAVWENMCAVMRNDPSCFPTGIAGQAGVPAIDQGVAMHARFHPLSDSEQRRDIRWTVSGSATCQYLGDIFGQHFPILQAAVWGRD